MSVSFLFSCLCSPRPRALLSFPTRRSSDLGHHGVERDLLRRHADGAVVDVADLVLGREPRGQIGYIRSEEHTSELQSRVDLVCRLLLEKKQGQNVRNSCKMRKNVLFSIR